MASDGGVAALEPILAISRSYWKHTATDRTFEWCCSDVSQAGVSRAIWAEITELLGLDISLLFEFVITARVLDPQLP